jgi:hypothetical protein
LLFAVRAPSERFQKNFQTPSLTMAWTPNLYSTTPSIAQHFSPRSAAAQYRSGA